MQSVITIPAAPTAIKQSPPRLLRPSQHHTASPRTPPNLLPAAPLERFDVKSKAMYMKYRIDRRVERSSESRYDTSSAVERLKQTSMALHRIIRGEKEEATEDEQMIMPSPFDVERAMDDLKRSLQERVDRCSLYDLGVQGQTAERKMQDVIARLPWSAAMAA